jgi:peptidoglycan-associated lipoprotein
MRNSIRIILVALVVGLLAGCQSTPLKDNSATVTDQSSNKPSGGADSNQVANVRADSSQDLAGGGLLAKRSVYFDYDSFIVKDEYKSLVEAHARNLTTHKALKIVVQGNADERGGSEYNLALGQKRAEAVRRALMLMGVADNQIEAVSFGKEKPKALGHDEAAWAENRRADIVYP